MNVSARQLWKQLRSANLLPLTLDAASEPPGETPEELVDTLAQKGWLTPFQRDRILAGHMTELVIGNYRLLRELAQGPGGKVYQAEHVFLKQPVVIRVSPPPLPSPALLDRWLSHLNLVSRWNHAVIVGISDSGVVAASGEKEALYFVSPFIEGLDLVELLRREGPLPVGRACELLHPIARALGDAHNRNMVHGALIPQSIRYAPDRSVKLVDFGLKAPSRGLQPESATPILEPATAQSDLAGLAACLCFALMGKLPEAGRPAGLMRAARPEAPALLDEMVQAFFGAAPESWSGQRIQETLASFISSRLTVETVYPPTAVIPPGAALTNDGTGAARAGDTLVLPPTPAPIPEKSGRSVLIVDDEPSIRSFCRMALARAGLECDEAANGLLALKTFVHHHYDLVLLDIDMPEMNGLDVCLQLRRIPNRPHVKIILFSGRVDADEMAPMLLAGADDYLTKPFTPVQLINRVQAALRLKKAQERSDVLNRDLLVLNRELEEHLQKRDSDLVDARNALVLGLAKLAEYRDADTGKHLRRLQVFSQRLAEEALRHPAFAGQLDANYIHMLACCAPLHDIGKVGLPDHVLLKPTKLDEEERLLMQTHTVIGAETLTKVAEEHGFAVAFLQMSIDITRHHHERFDGSGYPDHLSGVAIPLSARIVAVCDVYDALRSRRVYKPPLSHASVADYIRQAAGTHFDPFLVECFKACEKEFEKIYEQLKD